MSKGIKLLEKLLPHINLILAVMFITFLILDQYNPMMNFVNNDFSFKLLWAWGIVSVLQSSFLILKKYKK